MLSETTPNVTRTGVVPTKTLSATASGFSTLKKEFLVFNLFQFAVALLDSVPSYSSGVGM